MTSPLVEQNVRRSASSRSPPSQGVSFATRTATHRPSRRTSIVPASDSHDRTIAAPAPSGSSATPPAIANGPGVSSRSTASSHAR